LKDELPEEEFETYSRQIVLKDIGYEGQLKLRKSRVCIVGLGGLGCPLAVQLTAMGVGYLRLVDRDVVERSNLQRQHLYDVKTIGYPKVEVAARKLGDLNPDVEIEPTTVSINTDNGEDVLKGVDVVADGLDRIETRYVVNRACVKLGIPYVFGAAVEAFGNASTIIPGKTACLECFFPNLRDELLPTCGAVGVHPSVLGVVSSLEVSEVTRLIIGEKPLLADRLIYCDLRHLTFDKISVSRLEDCPVCGSKSPRSPAPVRRKFVEEICGRSGKRVFVIIPKENLELPMENLHKYVDSKENPPRVKAHLGVTFGYNSETTVSILRSGVMIIEGTRSQEAALKIYEEVVVDSLHIPRSRIEQL